MEIKDLTDLGMTEEQAKQTLELHNAELTAEQQKVTDLTSQLDAAQKNIGDLTEQVKRFDGTDIDALKKAASDWETKYNEDVAALKVDNAIDVALIGANALDVEIVKSQLDRSLMKLDKDGNLTGLTEQLEKLRNDKAFLFKSDEPKAADSGARMDTGFRHNTAAASTTEAQARAIMGLPAGNGGKK